jgi:hypothetical protein
MPKCSKSHLILSIETHGWAKYPKCGKETEQILSAFSKDFEKLMAMNMKKTKLGPLHLLEKSLYPFFVLSRYWGNLLLLGG